MHIEEIIQPCKGEEEKEEERKERVTEKETSRGEIDREKWIYM